MSKHVLMISTSLRHPSNSDTLANAFKGYVKNFV